MDVIKGILSLALAIEEGRSATVINVVEGYNKLAEVINRKGD